MPSVECIVPMEKELFSIGNFSSIHLRAASPPLTSTKESFGIDNKGNEQIVISLQPRAEFPHKIWALVALSRNNCPWDSNYRQSCIRQNEIEYWTNFNEDYPSSTPICSHKRQRRKRLHDSVFGCDFTT
eukprot:1176114-Prorocentrum_minimum.AAC.4